MAKLRLIDRWAAFTDEELLVLEARSTHAPVDCAHVAVEWLSDEIGAEIQRRADGAT